MALVYACGELQRHREVVLEAVVQNCHALHFAFGSCVRAECLASQPWR